MGVGPLLGALCDGRVDDLIDDLGRYGGGAAPAACPALAALMKSPGLPVEMLVARVLSTLRERPSAHVPLRHSHSGGISILQLAGEGSASLSLIAYAPSAACTPEAVLFADGDRVETVIAGEARIGLVTIAKGPDEGTVLVTQSERQVAPGDRFELDGAREAKYLAALDAGPVVMLRLARAPKAPGPSREVRLSDGKILHSTSGSRTASRHMLFVEMLGSMGRTDAAPVLAGMTAGSGEDSLRWQALRHALALDTASGFAALSRLAADPSDSLSETAGALRAQLLEAHPVLAQWEADLCPA